ncbi:MAG: hypothetical protein PUD65_06710 [Spirochaetales bacterium]|nr:hypothetical protein [Spirochaetales bacterium]
MRIKQPKRIISLLIILLIASSLFAASAVKYDQFINQATEFFGSYLSSDIKVTLVNVESEYPEFSEELLNDLEKKLINFGCTVLDRKNTDAIVAELEFQSSGLVDDREAVSIGHMLGADMIIVGKATNKGDYMKLELSLIDISTTLVVRKEDWNIKYDDTLLSLMKGEGDTVGNKFFSVGLKGGMMFASNTPHEDMIGTGVNPDVENGKPIVASLFFAVRPFGSLRIQTEVDLTWKNYLKISGMGIPETIIEYSSFEIPLILSYEAIKRPVSVEVYGGAYISMPLGDLKLTLTDVGSATIKLKGNTLGVVGGFTVGKDLGPGKLFADFRVMNDFDSFLVDGKFVYHTYDGYDKVEHEIDLAGSRLNTRKGATLTLGYQFSL